MDKRILLGLGGAAVVVIAAIFMLSRGGSGPKGDYSFETATVERGDVARIVSASGAVQPLNQVDVGSEVSGKIIDLYVDFNSPVKKDQVLAQIDPETFETAVQQARARLDQSDAAVANARSAIDRSKVNLEVAEENYKRQKTLHAEQAISQAAWEQADRDYKYAKLDLQNNEVSLQSAIAGQKQARASLEETQAKLERTKIRSPIDGVIINREVNVGQTVQSSMSVAKFFTIAQDLSQIQIEASVVESDIGGIDDGDPVTFTVDAFPGESFRGVVSQVRKLGAEQANVVTYTVVVSARNPQQKLLPGMTANVEITADRATDVLRVEADATQPRIPKELLATLEQGDSQPAQGGPSAGGGPGGARGGGNPMGDWLKAAGVDDERANLITTEFRGKMEELRASMPRTEGGGQRGIASGGFGPPPSIAQQQQMNEFRQKMQAMQDEVLKRHLSTEELEAFNKQRAEQSSRKRVTGYVLNDKGELQPKPLVIGLSDGSYSEIVRGAEEGDQLVVRATLNKKKS
ncbi:MAG: efflux RND transporter periplasmic adaptor subunit [Hyphomonadaceae bacterium]